MATKDHTGSQRHTLPKFRAPKALYSIHLKHSAYIEVVSKGETCSALYAHGWSGQITKQSSSCGACDGAISPCGEAPIGRSPFMLPTQIQNPLRSDLHPTSSKARSPDRSVLAPSSDARSPDRSVPVSHLYPTCHKTRRSQGTEVKKKPTRTDDVAPSWRPW